jgi:hypothetical protein
MVAERKMPLQFALRSTARRARHLLDHVLRPSRLHIVFFSHNHAILHNFDNSLRNFLRNGHKITIVLPEAKPGEKRRERQWRGIKQGRITFKFGPRFRGDRFEVLANYVRKARTSLLYRNSIFTQASVIQKRVAEATPQHLKNFLDSPWVRRCPRFADFFCRLVEAAIPASDQAKRFIASLKPDIVLITPYIAPSTRYQIEYAKAARELGVPVGVPVHSWDNLTSKEAIQVQPDRLFVWNKTQVKEAVRIHNVPRSRISVTGGMRFANFFGTSSELPREDFCKSVGLDPNEPLLTYLGSSRTIAPDEHLFLWRWIAAVRAAADPVLRQCNIFVRPHPHNSVIWDHWPKTSPARVAVWDGRGNDIRGIIESVSHSVAVIGINTTAMLEAAALEKPVLTVVDENLSVGQTQRVHFQYLTDGLVTAAFSLEDHVADLTNILHGDTSFARKSKTFVRSFLAPPWPFSSPVKAFQIAVEQFARSPYPRPFNANLLPILLRPIANWLAGRIMSEPAQVEGPSLPDHAPPPTSGQAKVVELAR